jgi:hypothetical protein
MFKKLTGIFLITLILTMLIVYNPLANIKELEAVVVLDDVILIAVMAAVCIVAGYIFYNYDDMAENALFIYANLPEATRVKIDEAVINGGAVVTISGAMIDDIYGVYWDKLVASGEYLKDAINGIYTSIVEDFSFVIENGKLRFINVATGGGYYSDVSAFPNFDDLRHNRTSLGGVAKAGFNIYQNGNRAAWSFVYNGVTYNYLTTLSAEIKDFFRSSTNKIVGGVTYYLTIGTASGYNGAWIASSLNPITGMCIATMAVAGVVRDYIVLVKSDGSTAYYPLWTVVDIGSGYVLSDINCSWSSGSKSIDYGKSASTGVMDRNKTGNEVLGLTGTATRDITIPIDNPQSMLGTNSAGALAGVWANTSEYSIVGEAVISSEVTWSEYTGDMKEMSLPAIIISKFPFCIPFDLAFAILALSANPVAPVFHITGIPGMFNSVDIEIDFSKFQLLATILRWGILIMFNIGLIKLTRTIIRG